MSRPEHVRCENCCYWDRSFVNFAGEEVAESCRGQCRIRADSEPVKHAGTFCGEFRREWPEEPNMGVIEIMARTQSRIVDALGKLCRTENP